MIYRTLKENVDEYYDNNALNQTAIKVIIEQGMEAYLNQAELLKTKEDTTYYEEKEYFLIGSAVDTFITMGEEYYLDNYHFSSCKKPGDTVLSIVKQVYDKLKVHGETIVELKDYQELIYHCCNEQKYYMNRAKPSLRDAEANALLPDDSPKIITWKHDNRWLDVVKTGTDYFNDLKKADGKQVLSDEQNQKVSRIIASFTTHPHTEWLFKDGDGIDIFYQLPIYFEVDGIYCKALLDMVRVDYNQGNIAIIDIKTLSDYVTKFNRHIRKRRYDIQGSFYKQAMLRKGCIQLSNLTGKSLLNYRVSNTAFVVESTIKQGTPLIFPLTDSLNEIGFIGNSDDLCGWSQGLELYKLWQSKNFSVEDMFYQWKGIIPVDENFEYTKHF